MSRAAIIVVGGRAQRLGGVNKPWLSIQGKPMIDHILESTLPHVQQCVLVGDAPDGWSNAAVVLTREEPAGGGPVAAVRAGMQLLRPDIDEVLLLAGDAPFIDDALSALLTVELTDGAVAVEADGRSQYLCARVRRSDLDTALAAAETSMQSVFKGLRVHTVSAALMDADTWEDVAVLRQESHMNDWLSDVTSKLGIDASLDIDAVLDLARDVAHHTERKNAPLTSYLLGYAAAAQNLTQAQVAALAAEIGQMAKDRA